MEMKALTDVGWTLPQYVDSNGQFPELKSTLYEPPCIRMGIFSGPLDSMNIFGTLVDHSGPVLVRSTLVDAFPCPVETSAWTLPDSDGHFPAFQDQTYTFFASLDRPCVALIPDACFATVCTNDPPQRASADTFPI